MCKVMFIAGVKQDKIGKTMELVKQLGRLMSVSNQDGIGYSAMTRDGNIFGERWLHNNEAWKDKIAPSRSHVRAAKKFPGLLPAAVEIEVKDKNSFGTKDFDNMTSIMLHTRWATSAKGMHNTHPFVTEDGKTALIHNGVISNEKDFKLTLSTCDSECILISYLNHDTMNNMKAIQNVADDLRGGYATGVLHTDTKTLDIFKTPSQRLSYAFVDDIDAYVFTTEGDDIKEACKTLGYKHESVFTFKDDFMLRLDAVTGNCIGTTEFKSGNRPYSSHSSGYNYPEYNKPSWEGAKEVNGSTLNSQIKSVVEYSKAKATITKLEGAELYEAMFFAAAEGE